MTEAQNIIANNVLAMIGRGGQRYKFNSPEELGQAFIDYCEFAKSQRWLKREFIKSGPRAGEVLEVEVRTPMSANAFCMFSGLSASLFTYFVKPDSYKNSGAAYSEEYEEYIRKMHPIAKEIRACIDNQQFEGAMVGAYHAGLVTRMLGLADRAEVTGADGGAINVQQITGMVVK